MSLSRIRLELARMDGFPNGSSEHGYVFVAPLDEDGKIDLASWQDVKDECWVKRFWGRDPELRGSLRRHGQYGWYFDYQKGRSEDDEPIFKLDKHQLVENSYVSITEHDGVQRPFKIVEVSNHETA